MKYFLIKAQPLRLNSNIKYLKLYKRDNQNKEMILERLDYISSHILELSYDYFDGISKEEFQKKCEDATKILYS